MLPQHIFFMQKQEKYFVDTSMNVVRGLHIGHIGMQYKNFIRSILTQNLVSLGQSVQEILVCTD